MSPEISKNKIKKQIKILTQEIKEHEQEQKNSIVFRNMMPLPKKIPIWLCGYTNHKDFQKTRQIPGQEFDGDRYVRSVASMKNSDADWKKFINKL